MSDRPSGSLAMRELHDAKFRGAWRRPIFRFAFALMTVMVFVFACSGGMWVLSVLSGSSGFGYFALAATITIPMGLVVGWVFKIIEDSSPYEVAQ